MGGHILDNEAATWRGQVVPNSAQASPSAPRASDGWLHRVLNVASDAIVLVDDVDRIRFVNTAASRLMGWSTGELQGRPLAEVLLSASAVGWPDEAGGMVLGRDGKRIPVDTVTTPQFHDDDTPAGRALVLRPTPDPASTHATVVKERMASLGTLTAGLAHEINNPLTYNLVNQSYAIQEVQDILDALRTSPSATLSAAQVTSRLQEVLSSLQEAADGAERVRGLIRDLRTFARADTGRWARVELAAVVESALRLTHGEVKHKASLRQELGAAPVVMGNDGQLCQVVVNLIINAAQAMDQAGPDHNEITVTLGTAGEGHAVMAVHDTGSGIPTEVLPHVFERFFTTKPAGTGTGLGLTICQEIITAHRGTISVRNRKERGATVEVCLPAAPVTA
ncbi:MAG: ATP-binding protein [Myxococcota bacterium]